MYDLPNSTLSLHLNPPFQTPSVLSEVSLRDFSKVILSFKNTPKPDPETAVLKFYFLNHVFHHITSQFHAHEELPSEVLELVEARTKNTAIISARVMSHTFLTLLYELNWLHSPPGGRGKQSGDKFIDDMRARFGDAICDHFNRSGTGGFQMGIFKDFADLDVPVGDYVRAMYNIYTTSPHLNAIGKDKQWIAIAGVPLEFVSGRSSLEEVCDKAFSLFHWGGSIFNKQIYYTENTNTMLHLLDVQDSGQIPALLNEAVKGKGKLKSSSGVQKFIDSDLQRWVQLAQKNFPDFMSTPLNQSLVNAAKAKREKGLHATISQRNNGAWGWGGGRQNQANQTKNAPKTAPIQKIDEIVFGAFGFDPTKPKGP